MRTVFIGCIEFSHSMLIALLGIPGVEVVGIVTKSRSKFNADFCSLEPTATAQNIPCFLVSDNEKAAMTRWVSERRPDAVFCLGWSSLLPRSILDIPTLGVVGYHPAHLPQNRGRHPIVWALALGLTSTASTFFFMDEGADSGDILSQQLVPITPSDDASSLYSKLSKTALIQIADLAKKLVAHEYIRTPQDHSCSNYWRKRTDRDSQIDWRMSAKSIYNLVRALTKPYVGAHCEYNGQCIKVWKTEIVADGDENIEPGKVLAHFDGTFVVKCGEGSIRLLKHEFEVIPKVGSYL